MNKEIQPEFKEVTVTCACGTVYTTHSAILSFRPNVEGSIPSTRSINNKKS